MKKYTAVSLAALAVLIQLHQEPQVQQIMLAMGPLFVTLSLPIMNAITGTNEHFNCKGCRCSGSGRSVRA